MIYPPGKPFCSFGLREDEWIKHLLIVGMSGAGKTNLTFRILRQLEAKKKPFLVFDWEKNYRDLRQLPEFKDLIVFTVSRKAVPFHFNPLIPPPGTGPGDCRLIPVCTFSYSGFWIEGNVTSRLLSQLYEVGSSARESIAGALLAEDRSDRLGAFVSSGNFLEVLRSGVPSEAGR